MPTNTNTITGRLSARTPTIVLAALAALTFSAMAATPALAATSPTANPSGGSWAGYLEAAPAGEAFTSITGTFNVPVVAPTAAGYWLGEWIGVEGGDANGVAGMSGDYLLQAAVEIEQDPGGGESAGACTDDVQYQFGCMGEGPTVAPGDEVTTTMTNQGVGDGDCAVVTLAPGVQVTGDEEWSLTITDDTTGATASTTDCFPVGAAQTAEWMIEQATSYLPLPEFGTVSFTDLATTGASAGTPREDWFENSVANAESSESPLTTSGFNISYRQASDKPKQTPAPTSPARLHVERACQRAGHRTVCVAIHGHTIPLLKGASTITFHGVLTDGPISRVTASVATTPFNTLNVPLASASTRPSAHGTFSVSVPIRGRDFEVFTAGGRVTDFQLRARSPKAR